MGGRQFYGKGYAPVSVDDDHNARPDTYVIYTLTAYLDYSDDGLFVTRIEITDPAVSIYGISCGSSLDEFDRAFQDLGCEIQDNGAWHIAKHGKTKVIFNASDDDRSISVSVEITNRNGIQF